MKKFKTDCGYVVYEVTIEELRQLGGMGVCDHCNKPAAVGYLVPVLNRWLCQGCYAEFNARAKFYPEDLKSEEFNCRYYESIIPME